VVQKESHQLTTKIRLDHRCAFEISVKTVLKVFNGDTAYIAQLKQQKSKMCHYFCIPSLCQHAHLWFLLF